MALCLDCFFDFNMGLGMGERDCPRSLLSPIRNCESAVIGTPAKEASLPSIVKAARIMGFHMVSGDSTDHRRQRGFWWVVAQIVGNPLAFGSYVGRTIVISTTLAATALRTF